MAVIVLVATRGGSDGPDHAVEDYATAIRDGGCDALVATVSATKWEHDDERFTADFTLVDEDGWKVLFCPAFPSLPCA